METDHNGLEILDRSTCLELLRSTTVGRVGVNSGGHPVVLPVNFALLGSDIIIRTGPGTKLVAALLGSEAAFEVDHIDAGGYGWSVLIHGHATEIEDAETLQQVNDLPLRPWAGGLKDHFIRIPLENISGRSLPGEAHTAQGSVTTPYGGGSTL